MTDNQPSSPIVSPDLSAQSSKTPSPSRVSHAPRSPSRKTVPSLATTTSFTHLLAPTLYHPLPTLHLAPPFRSPSAQPDPNTALPALLSGGHFRPAAILAAHLLTTSTSATDHGRLFALFYVRLACLTLIGCTPLAAAEVKALEDLSSSAYVASAVSPTSADELPAGPSSPAAVAAVAAATEAERRHLVPWRLRVLAVRLQGLGFNDPRRGIVGYYDLARDARARLTSLKSGVPAPAPATTAAEIALWEARLADLGIRVAGALVEMEDLEGAARCLEGLGSRGAGGAGGAAADEADGWAGRLAVSRALLYLRIGNLAAAAAVVSSFPAESPLHGLVASFSSGRAIAPSLPSERHGAKDASPLVRCNEAVALLYSGNLLDARKSLEGLVEDGYRFETLIFNLSTVYELCTEKAKNLKLELADKLATRDGVDGIGGGGASLGEKSGVGAWEIGVSVLKL